MHPTTWPIILLVPPGERAPGETRERVLTTVRKYPGLGAADVARQANTSLQLAEYHLHALTKSGLVTTRDEDGPSVYFAITGADDAPVVDRRDRALVATLRRPMVLRIALQLLESGSMPMGELASSCGISPATITHHIKRLHRNDIVGVEVDGRSRRATLTDADRLRQVLIDHPPPRDLVAGFIEMWDRLDAGGS